MSELHEGEQSINDSVTSYEYNIRYECIHFDNVFIQNTNDGDSAKTGIEHNITRALYENNMDLPNIIQHYLLSPPKLLWDMLYVTITE